MRLLITFLYEFSEKIAARRGSGGPVCHHFVCLFLPCQCGGFGAWTARPCSRHRCRSGSQGVHGTHRRAYPLDQFAVRWYAHLPDVSQLRIDQCAQLGGAGLPALYPRLHLLCIHHVAGLLSAVACLRLPGLDGNARCGIVGILVLLLHHHCSRTHLEGADTGLHSCHHCRYGADIPWQVAVGCTADSPVRRTADTLEPRADDLLLPLPHALHGHSLWCRSLAQREVGPLLEVIGHPVGCGTGGCMYQPVEPLSHL